MAFAHTNKKGQTYYLHQKMVQLQGNNRQQPIFFFAKVAKEGALDAVPDGFEVKETETSGLPVLKKKAR